MVGGRIVQAFTWSGPRMRMLAMRASPVVMGLRNNLHGVLPGHRLLTLCKAVHRLALRDLG